MILFVVTISPMMMMMKVIQAQDDTGIIRENEWKQRFVVGNLDCFRFSQSKLEKWEDKKKESRERSSWWE